MKDALTRWSWGGIDVEDVLIFLGCLVLMPLIIAFSYGYAMALIHVGTWVFR